MRNGKNRERKRRRLTQGVVCVLAGCLCLWAKGEEPIELEPVVVEAWHFDMVGEQVPADLLRLEGEDLRSGSGEGVVALLRDSGGIQFRGVTGNGTKGELAMRGFGENSGLRVLVLVDGQSYNPADMGGINWLGLDIGELESVEIIRGGQTVLYGNHALSGVIKLQTRIPMETAEGSIEGAMGSDGLWRGGLSWGYGAGHYGVRLSGRWEESDGYREDSEYNSRTLRLSGKAVLAEAGTWKGRLAWSRNEISLPGPLDFETLMEDPRRSANAGREWNTGDSLTGTLHGSGETDWGHWQLQSGYLDREREWLVGGRPAENTLERISASPRLQIGNEERFLIIGTDAQSEQLEYLEYLESGRNIVLSRADLERQTLGGYLFLSRSMSERVVLSGGIRIEQTRTENLNIHYMENQLLPELETNRGTIENPDYRNPPDPDPDLSFEGTLRKSGWAGELSVLAKLREDMNIWAGWDHVYRYPALDETASFQGYPLADPLNEDLNPETGHNFEVGLKHFKTNWHVSATVYAMYLDDEIVYDSGERLNVNIGSTERQGAELDGAWSGSRYGFMSRISWARARLGKDTAYDGYRVPLVPVFTGTATFWIQPLNQLKAFIGGRYQSSMFQGNDFVNTERKVPAYGTLHFSLRWNPDDFLSISFSVSNLLDKTYASTAYSGGFYPGAGRQGVVQMELTY